MNRLVVSNWTEHTSAGRRSEWDRARSSTTRIHPSRAHSFPFVDTFLGSSRWGEVSDLNCYINLFSWASRPCIFSWQVLKGLLCFLIDALLRPTFQSVQAGNLSKQAGFQATFVQYSDADTRWSVILWISHWPGPFLACSLRAYQTMIKRNRSPFMLIYANLDIAGRKSLWTIQDYAVMHARWRVFIMVATVFLFH